MTLSRPTTIEGVKQALENFSTVKSAELGKSYQPDPSDVFICTYPKCGTTWMQQIVHCLRSSGDMNFSEITEAVPWLELSHDLHMDNTASQGFKPGAFKSHFSWDLVPKGGRYIHIARNPEDVLISFYQFFSGWYFEKGSISINDFTHELFLNGTGSGLYWHHVNQWWQVRDRKEVLFLCYEDMLAQPSRMIETVAEFIGIALTKELKKVTLKNSSVEFMRQHKNQFDDHLVKQHRDHHCGLPADSESSKISDSKSKKPQLSPSIKQALQNSWNNLVTPAVGLRNYNHLREQLKTLI